MGDVPLLLLIALENSQQIQAVGPGHNLGTVVLEDLVVPDPVGFAPKGTKYKVMKHGVTKYKIIYNKKKMIYNKLFVTKYKIKKQGVQHQITSK